MQTYTDMYTEMYTEMCMCMHMYMCLYVYVYVRMHLCMYVWRYACLCTCMCVGVLAPKHKIRSEITSFVWEHACCPERCLFVFGLDWISVMKGRSLHVFVHAIVTMVIYTLRGFCRTEVHRTQPQKSSISYITFLNMTSKGYNLTTKTTTTRHDVT